MFKLDLEKVEEPEIKLPTSVGSYKKQENSRRTSTSASLTVLKPLTVWVTTNWKILRVSNAAAAAKSLQPCPTLCNLVNGSPPGSSIPGILQARVLEWGVISFSNACMHAKLLQSCLILCNPMDSSPPGSSVHRIL